MARIVATFVLLLASGCGDLTSEAVPVPTAPAAPPGWTTVGTFGGEGGNGFVGAAFDVDLTNAEVALNAACTGDGTLVVFVGAAEAAGEVPSVVIPCSQAGEPHRVELAESPASTGAEFRAALVEPSDGARHGAFNVSVERRDD